MNFFKKIDTRYIYKFIYNYSDKKIDLLSSGLTFLTAFAIFPLLSLIIGISKGFGLDEILIEKLVNIIPSNEKTLFSIISIIQNLITSVKTGVVAGISIIFILWSVIKVLLMLEDVFNNIWNISKKRNKTMQIINYVALIFLIPIFLIFIFSSSNLVVDFLVEIFNNEIVKTKIILQLFNLLLLIMLLTILFYLIPNAKINIKYSFYSAIFSGISIIIVSKLYYFIQQNLNSYNAIYGSLAFVPIFLIVLKFIWTIILVGVQINHMLQLKNDLIDPKNISYYHKKNISLYIYGYIIRNFYESKGAMGYDELSEITGIKNIYIAEALQELEKLGYVYEINDDEKNIYSLKINPKELKIKDFYYIIEKKIIDIDEMFVDKKNEYFINKYINFLNKVDIENNMNILDINVKE